MIDTIIGKEQFLIEHNRLSPANLQATFALLTQFQEEKKPLLQDADWSFRLRVPLISWLLIIPRIAPEKKNSWMKPKKDTFRNYPETH